MATLREVRERVGLTQQELANRARITPSTVHLLERSGAKPRRATLDALRHVLGDVVDHIEWAVRPEKRHVRLRTGGMDYRTAYQRAAATTNGGELRDVYTQATAIGNKLLRRAAATIALERGDLDLVRDYAGLYAPDENQTTS